MTSKVKEIIKKTWKFIWENDSPLSWALNVLIAFVLVKFIVYPGLGLLLGTTHPVVAVVSGSMSHNLENRQICGTNPIDYENSFNSYWNICGGWYEKNYINKEMASEWRFKNGFNKGDIIILKGISIDAVGMGDVIVFKSFLPDPIIHRVVKNSLNNNVYILQTKGDHNSGPIPEHGENNVTRERLIGKAVFRIPFLGWIKIIAVDMLNSIKSLLVGG